MIYNASAHITRKILTVFMDFFSSIYVQKYKRQTDNTITVYKTVQVPVMYATAEKWLQVLRSGTARKGFDPALLAQNPVEIEVMLPRIGVEVVGMNYDPTRHFGKTNRITSDYIGNDPLSKKGVFSPVPWNLQIELDVIARNINELFQVVEQIIPFFSPSLSLDVKIYPDKEPDSMPFVLDSINPNVRDEIGENDERVFIYSLFFTVKANYYLPVKVDDVILNVAENIYVDVSPRFQIFVDNATIGPPIGYDVTLGKEPPTTYGV
jgi:hypothetical protein